MQHYELPTRLLDITQNPFVALYFAVIEDINEDGRIDVFFVKKQDLNYYDESIVNLLSLIGFAEKEIFDVNDNPEKKNRFIHFVKMQTDSIPFINDLQDIDKVLCVLPKLDNPRIIRQQGAFFLYGIKNGVKESMSENEISTISFLVKKEEKRKIREELDNLGINEKYCFPEIDKVAHYLKQNI